MVNTIDAIKMEHSQLAFGQTKLSKNEWEYLEMPIHGTEKTIIDFIHLGNTNNILYPYESLVHYLKMDNNTICDIELFITENYLKDYIIQLFTLLELYNSIYRNSVSNYSILKDKLADLLPKYNITINLAHATLTLKNNRTNAIRIKTKDKIRLTNTFSKKNMNEFINNDKVYDFVYLKQLINILHFCFKSQDNATIDINSMFKTPSETKAKIAKCMKDTDKYFNTYSEFNSCVMDRIYGLLNIINEVDEKDACFCYKNIVKEITLFIASNITDNYAIQNACGWMENNAIMNKYSSIKLYEHQKQIINILNNGDVKNNFIYYCAPTGTGKTLTPLAIANKYKVIFVCAARHIGLTFARNAISCGYKIALAFNCNDSEDIRLHYSAAKVFTKNYKSGGIYKVDNTVGDKVDIVISDLKSYPYAALYMKAFNNINNIVTFWDEPTISLDYAEHTLHEIIHKNWNENIVPNMVLSSATLPNNTHVENVAKTFSEKFNCNIHYIKTSEYKKSICIYDLNSTISTPHLFLKKMNASYEYMRSILSSIMNDNTLMRYLHVESCIDFINYYGDGSITANNWYSVTSNDVKNMYINTFYQLTETEWAELTVEDGKLVRTYYDSTIYFLTKDAYTLTNGASIFLTNDVFKIAKFCFQQLSINRKELDYIFKAIEYNNVILNKIKVLEKQAEDEEKKMDPNGEKEKKMSRMFEDENVSKVKRIHDKIEQLYNSMKKTHINNIYIPNSYEHLSRHTAGYAEKYKKNGSEKFKPFTSTLNDNDIMRVVSIPDVEDYWRLLLMCGIGIVSDTMNNEYNILINEFASDKKLYMLIASSDYIYGTNYAFHHGYIGKDMKECSRQKIIQALGRIGRGQTNQHYSIRMRDDAIINILFNEHMNNSIEADNMNRLFKFDNDDCVNEEHHYTQTEAEMMNELIADGWMVEEAEITASIEEPEKFVISVAVGINTNGTDCDDWEELCL